MYVHVCMCVCMSVCVQISSLKPLDQLKPGYVYNDNTSRTPGCVTDMVSELGLESLEDRCQIYRLCLLYETHHRSVDIDKIVYLRPGDSRTRRHAGLYQEHTKHEENYNWFLPSVTAPKAGEKSCCQWCRFSYLWCYCLWCNLITKSKSSCQWCTLALPLVL